jgi:hypothetical protein
VVFAGDTTGCFFGSGAGRRPPNDILHPFIPAASRGVFWTLPIGLMSPEQKEPPTFLWSAFVFLGVRV